MDISNRPNLPGYTSTPKGYAKVSEQTRRGIEKRSKQNEREGKVLSDPAMQKAALDKIRSHRQRTQDSRLPVNRTKILDGSENREIQDLMNKIKQST